MDCIVREYPAEAWATGDSGFVTQGSPSVYYQDDKGHTIWRTQDIDSMYSRLCQIRKPQDGYNPAKDPQGPAPMFAESDTVIVPVLMIVVCVFVFMGIVIAIVRHNGQDNSQNVPFSNWS